MTPTPDSKQEMKTLEGGNKLAKEITLALLSGGGHTTEQIGKELNSILSIFKSEIALAHSSGVEEGRTNTLIEIDDVVHKSHSKKETLDYIDSKLPKKE